MNIVFRVDAAPSIGGGHLSRCLTLASKLRDAGINCSFVMREHFDYLGQQVKASGFELFVLPRVNKESIDPTSYVTWVGASWEDDANQTYRVITAEISGDINWIIVDHYGLDTQWEKFFLDKGIRVGVIDDLVNRRHCGEFLLDQTCGRDDSEYRSLVECNTRLFVGERYCLLRDEFFLARHEAVKKRKFFKKIRTILVSFGSTDPTGHTLNALKGLASCALSNSVEVLVVVGSSCPFLSEIELLAKALPYKTTLYIDSSQVAKIITRADIAIGAAGVSTWERCFLGLPTLLVKTAGNQTDVVNRVISSGAALGYFHSLESTDELNMAIINLERKYKEISDSALSMKIGDGIGTIISFLSVRKGNIE